MTDFFLIGRKFNSNKLKNYRKCCVSVLPKSTETNSAIRLNITRNRITRKFVHSIWTASVLYKRSSSTKVKYWTKFFYLRAVFFTSRVSYTSLSLSLSFCLSCMRVFCLIEWTLSHVCVCVCVLWFFSYFSFYSPLLHAKVYTPRVTSVNCGKSLIGFYTNWPHYFPYFPISIFIARLPVSSIDFIPIPVVHLFFFKCTFCFTYLTLMCCTFHAVRLSPFGSCTFMFILKRVLTKLINLSPYFFLPRISVLSTEKIVHKHKNQCKSIVWWQTNIELFKVEIKTTTSN